MTAMAKLRVHNIAMSVDGYMAGPNQSLDNPLGEGGESLHEWVFKTKTWTAMTGEEGGEQGIDDRFMARGDEGIGATIMGRNMFGPIRGLWEDNEWKGWWGIIRRTTIRSSCLRAMPGNQYPWRAGPRSIS